MKLVLHNYWRSSASHRVRIGLGLKQLAYEYVVVNIVKDGQFAEAYRARNPIAQVPTLEITEDDGTRRALTQSLPILEYLEERFPEVPILPKDPYLRARARGLAELVNSGIQPHQNLTTTKRVRAFGGDDVAWVKAFLADGLAAYARSAADVAGAFSVGDAPSMADFCLVPQLASARRFGVLEGSGWSTTAPWRDGDRDHLDRLLAIEARCLAMPAFANAAPEQQPDAAK